MPGNPLKFILLMPVILLAACASTPKPSDETGLEALERRVMARWQHLIAGETLQAYEYLTPGYRSTRTPESYIRTVRSPAISWTSASWRDATCSTPDSCLVDLLLSYSVRIPNAGQRPGFRAIQERWLNVDGQWYHLPER